MLKLQLSIDAWNEEQRQDLFVLGCGGPLLLHEGSLWWLVHRLLTGGGFSIAQSGSSAVAQQAGSGSERRGSAGGERSSAVAQQAGSGSSGPESRLSGCGARA